MIRTSKKHRKPHNFSQHVIMAVNRSLWQSGICFDLVVVCNRHPAAGAAKKEEPVMEVFSIHTELLAEHAEGMLGRELTEEELEAAVKSVRRQIDRYLQALIENAITDATDAEAGKPA